ncbi:MAG: sulfatase-like hydrolase/transferase [Akkermansiaceae bacterium]
MPTKFHLKHWLHLFLGFGPFFLLAAAAGAEQAKPNLLLILADDWGWGDLGCHGHPYVQTPNIDRLAKEGTDFHRFTMASAVCSPSRAALMTGHFPARYNIDGHFAWPKDNARRNMPDWLSTTAPTLPGFLKSAGYATAHFGKWHLANDMIPDSPTPEAYGYDEYGAFNCAGEQMPVHEDAQRAISFIGKCHREGKPFFINLWLHEPHTPHHVIPKYRRRFPDLPEADNIYASVLSHADDRVGEILAALDRLGLAGNTLVIFTSDNGPARSREGEALELKYDTATGAGFGLAASKGVTGGRKGYKAALSEGGIGVPFLARWPGKIAADRIDDRSLISAVDLLPTLCEVAGLALPAGYQPDGVSQVAALLGTPALLRQRPLFWQIGAQKNSPTHWASFAVVDGHWKLLVNDDFSRLELYDLAADSLEQNDLGSARLEVVSELRGKLSQWQASLPPAPTGEVFSAER